MNRFDDIFAPLWVGWALLLAVGSLSAETMVVTASRLNVRARAGTQYEVVCQVTRDEKVTVVKREGDWVGIGPTPSAKAWVRSEHLDGDKVMAPKSIAYAGAATVFSELGSFAKGDSVTVHRVRQDGWAEVNAPANTVLWVHQNYLAPPTTDTTAAAAPDKPEPKPPQPGDVDPTRVAVPKPETGATPPPVAGANERWRPEPGSYQIHRIATDPQKGPIEYLGTSQPFAESAILIPLEDDNTPWPWALAIKINDTYYPLGYLDSKDAKIAEWQWREVVVSGTRRWARGWPRPVIEAKSVRLDD